MELASPQITLEIPSPLRHYCGGRRDISVEATSLQQVLCTLKRDHADLYFSVCNETGEIRQHVNLFVNSAIVCKTTVPDVELQPGDVVSIMPAVSGG